MPSGKGDPRDTVGAASLTSSRRTRDTKIDRGTRVPQQTADPSGDVNAHPFRNFSSFSGI